MNDIQGKALLISTFKKAMRQKGLMRLILDMLIHKLIINTDPRDYLYNGFFNDGFSMEEKARFISLRGSRYYPYESNPLKFNGLFTNKYIQKSIFQYLDIPTPRLITTIGSELEVSNQIQLNSFLENMRTDVFIKPISGTHGHGILTVSRKGGELYSGDKLISKLIGSVEPRDKATECPIIG